MVSFRGSSRKVASTTNTINIKIATYIGFFESHRIEGLLTKFCTKAVNARKIVPSISKYLNIIVVTEYMQLYDLYWLRWIKFVPIPQPLMTYFKTAEVWISITKVFRRFHVNAICVKQTSFSRSRQIQEIHCSRVLQHLSIFMKLIFRGRQVTTGNRSAFADWVKCN